MKRGVLTIFAFALLGLVLTLLTAWACETFAGESIEIHYDRPGDPLLRPGLYEPPEGWDVKTWVEFDGFGVEGVWVSEVPWGATTRATDSLPSQHDRGWYFSGWPMHCMTRTDTLDSRYGRTEKFSVWAEGFASPWPTLMAGSIRGKNLSIRPVPIRFAVNSLLWATATWLVILGPCQFKRWNRKRLGLCISCGYEITNLQTCPECGTAAKPRTMPQ